MVAVDERQRAMELVGRLGPMQLRAVVGLLEAMVEPVEVALGDAPEDDEPESEGERAEVAEAYRWLESNAGRGVPHVEAMRRLGLD